METTNEMKLSEIIKQDAILRKGVGMKLEKLTELEKQMCNILNTKDDIDSSRDCPEEFILKRVKAMDGFMSNYISEVSKNPYSYLEDKLDSTSM
jgi:hypothetical protein